MFGLGWEQIILILLAALFLLGPERIPGAVQWLMDNLRKLRTMASGAQSQMRSQLGPELDELRRQVADLQSLKELQELRQLRDLDPRRAVGKSLLGDEFSGGVTGFLGLDDTEGAAPSDGAPASDGAATAASEAAGSATPAPSAQSEGSPGAAPDRAATSGTNGSGASWLDADIT